jgi:maleylpyruvate isomerase
MEKLRRLVQRLSRFTPRSHPPRGKGYHLWVGGPVPKQAHAITLGTLIIVRRSAAAAPSFSGLLRHELTHVDQWQRLGYMTFSARYLTEYFQGRRAGKSHHEAYLAISFEIEARQHARLPFVATVGGMQPPTVTLETITEAHQCLNEFVSSLSDEQLRSPSRLPGWTVGHVVAHVALNARAFERAARSAMASSPSTMYDSVDSRNADIERHSTLTTTEATLLVSAACAAMEAVWGELFTGVDSGTFPASILDTQTATASGHPEFEINQIMLRRLREVEVHSIDCGIRTRSIDSWSSSFVDADIVSQFATVPRRTSTPVHVVDEQSAHYATPGAETASAVHLTRRQLLGWLLDRSDPTDLPALLPWGNQSAWSSPPQST